MTIIADFSKGYPTAEAERGKFVVLDPSTITDLPSASRGKYAILTYDIGVATAGESTSQAVTAAISESTDAIVGALTSIEAIIPTTPTDIEIKSSTLTNALSTISFTQPVQRIEIYNTNPLSTIYLSLVDGKVATFASLTATTMPIERYYATDFETQAIQIGATESSDVRIIGHF